MADSVLEVALEANKQIFEEWEGDGNMFESLMEVMEPQLQVRYAKFQKEGLQKGIQGSVDILRDLGHKDAEIKTIITKQYSLSEKEATEYLQ